MSEEFISLATRKQPKGGKHLELGSIKERHAGRLFSHRQEPQGARQVPATGAHPDMGWKGYCKVDSVDPNCGLFFPFSTFVSVHVCGCYMFMCTHALGGPMWIQESS